MTRREYLQDQYEDAMFALLMDEVALAEGERALEENEKLKADPNFVIPTGANQKCLRTIKLYFRKQASQKATRTFGKLISKVALIAFLSILLFSTALAASPTLRMNTLNLLIETLDDRTNLRLAEISPEGTDISGITTGWLPDQWILEDSFEDSRSIQNTYLTSNDDAVYISYYKLHNSALSVDSEGAVTKTLYICGQNALLLEKDGYTQLTWANNDAGVIILIEAPTCYTEDLIKIAENLKI